MTTIPNSPLVERAVAAMAKVDSNDVGSALDSEEYRPYAQAALAACHAEEMRSFLLRLADAHLGDRVFDEEQTYEIWREAVALLAKLAGKPAEWAV